jgi:hypothetical protein
MCLPQSDNGEGGQKMPDLLWEGVSAGNKELFFEPFIQEQV